MSPGEYKTLSSSIQLIVWCAVNADFITRVHMEAWACVQLKAHLGIYVPLNMNDNIHVWFGVWRCICVLNYILMENHL